MSQRLVTRSLRRWVIVGMVTIGAGALALTWQLGGILSVPSDQLLADAKLALKQHRFDEAEQLAKRVPVGDPVFPRARLVAGEAATRAGRLALARDYYASIPRDGSIQASLAAFSRAELLRDAGLVSDAERDYRYVLKQQPNDVATHERLAFLLCAMGRRWESLPHFMFLLKSGTCTFEELTLLGDLDRPVEQVDYLAKSSQHAVDDPLIALGLAAQASVDQSPDACRMLKDVVRRAPDLIAAQVMLGEELIEGEPTAFVQWHSQLPASANDYPHTWFVRGMWATHCGNLRVAARCFWELLRRDPTLRRGNYRLGQVLVAMNEPAGKDFAARSNQLYELTQKLDDVLRSKGRDERAVRRVTELLEETGRIWEACAWAARATQEFPSADWPLSVAKRLSSQLKDDLPRTLPSANLALKWDLSDYPGFETVLKPTDAPRGQLTKKQQSTFIRFEELTGVGIDFVYNNGADPATRGARMFEQTGGAPTVLDFDGDGLADLYFTQGGVWKTGSSVPEPPGIFTDRLFRNLDGNRFVDITAASRLIDTGFGQGCAAGDFDNDGFVDLFVTNIGRNQLLRNNGDGTFSDVTDRAGMLEKEWTVSGAVVDLNADGLPDLCAVNYLTGDNIFETICDGRACSPKGFDGVPSRIHINRGDGTFEMIPDPTHDTGAKGLGIVAFALNNRRRPSLFVANDQVPNFLLRNLPANNRFNLRLENEGFVSGLAFNQDGLAMASMGIAADDANGDGLIDFYVTTFKDEAKILFLQDANGFFVDATKTSGLGAPGLPFVGWGTQFLDADHDGHADLVVTNGHVDDYRDAGGEYQMRPQFFRNLGGGQFEELRASDAGEFFDRKYLGRGLSRLDWNADGRMDFVVSNMGDQVSLVTNRSQSACYLNVRLHAITTARDAIGSVVDVIVKQRRMSKQLVAGDGYMASNERVLQFGLGDATSVDSVKVTWPSGNSSLVVNVPTNGTVELIENRQHAILRTGQQSSDLQVVLSTPLDE